MFDDSSTPWDFLPHDLHSKSTLDAVFVMLFRLWHFSTTACKNSPGSCCPLLSNPGLIKATMSFNGVALCFNFLSEVTSDCKVSQKTQQDLSMFEEKIRGDKTPFIAALA